MWEYHLLLFLFQGENWNWDAALDTILFPTKKGMSPTPQMTAVRIRGKKQTLSDSKCSILDALQDLRTCVTNNLSMYTHTHVHTQGGFPFSSVELGPASPSSMKSCRRFLSVSGAPGEASTEDA